MPRIFHCYVALVEGKLIDWKYAVRRPSGSSLHKIGGRVVSPEERRYSGTQDNCLKFARSFPVHPEFRGSRP